MLPPSLNGIRTLLTTALPRIVFGVGAFVPWRSSITTITSSFVIPLKEHWLGLRGYLSRRASVYVFGCHEDLPEIHPFE